MPVLAEMMVRGLGLDTDFVLGMGRMSSHLYKGYRLKKTNGKSRQIWHPSRELKALQRFILYRVIRPGFRVHACAAAYEPGKNIAANAHVHAKTNFLLRMDFRNFFPSICSSDIRVYLDRHKEFLPPNWDDSDSELFCSLVCRESRLTIGAVTSPSLSNAICYELDDMFATLAARHNARYTRYADDLFFSTHDRDRLRIIESEVYSYVDNLECPANLTINRGKTRHTSKKRRRTVTGIVLTSQGSISVGRGYKRWIRSRIHKLDTLLTEEAAQLVGELAFLKSVEPGYLNNLILKFGLARVRAAQGKLPEENPPKLDKSEMW